MIYSLLIFIKLTLLFFPLAAGAFFSISLLKVPDLSIEAAYVFGGIVTAKMLYILGGVHTISDFLIIAVAGMVGGLCVGLVSSCLNQFAHFPTLLCSILTIGIFHGINQLVLGTANLTISQFDSSFSILETGLLPQEFATLILFSIFVLVLSAYLLRTQLGISFSVYGNNPDFFAHYGISGRYVFVVGILFANLLAGLAGGLAVQANGFVDVSMGFGIALLCVTILILGKIFTPYFLHRSIFVPIIGSCSYFGIQQLLLLIGFDSKYFTMIQSIIVLIALFNVYRIRFKKNLHISSNNLGV